MTPVDPDLLVALTTALGLGLLIGAVRERRKTDGMIVAGLRTHALTALAGAISLWLALPVFVAVVVVVGVFVGMSYRQTSAKDPGLTSEVALVLTALLGGLALRLPALAAGLGVVAAVLLYAKDPLHRLTRERLSEREVHDGLLLLASALVILPLLPDRPLGPYAALNLKTLWLLVVLVMAISALGHVALRMVGNRWGLAIAGFFAGYVSSTAAVAGFGQRVRAERGLLRPAVGAAMLANLASLTLVVPVFLAVSPAALPVVSPLLLAAGGTLLAGGLLGLRVHHGEAPAPPTSESRMFRFRHALGFALIVTAVLLVSAALNAWLGPRGAVATAIVAALAELHAAMATLGNLFGTGVLDAAGLRWAFVGLLAASATAKSVVAIASGGRAYGVRVTIGLFAMVAAAAASQWFPALALPVAAQPG